MSERGIISEKDVEKIRQVHPELWGGEPLPPLLGPKRVISMERARRIASRRLREDLRYILKQGPADQVGETPYYGKYDEEVIESYIGMLGFKFHIVEENPQGL